MEKNEGKITSIDEYCDQFPQEIKERLLEIRRVVKEAIPDAQEKISYQMPTFHRKKNLIHFAAHKNHIGVYPTPNGLAAFSKELSPYQSGKGSVQFPNDQPIPYELIRKIALFRAEAEK